MRISLSRATLMSPVAAPRPARGLMLMSLALLLVMLLGPLPALAQGQAKPKDSKGVGIVYGKVLKPDGRPLAGAWLMIENLELGMIYRKDVNPIGQFQFDDVFPGTYIFKLSPAVYLIKSPEKISVKADEALEVEVRVVPAPPEK